MCPPSPKAGSSAIASAAKRTLGPGAAVVLSAIKSRMVHQIRERLRIAGRGAVGQVGEVARAGAVTPPCRRARARQWIMIQSLDHLSFPFDFTATVVRHTGGGTVLVLRGVWSRQQQRAVPLRGDTKLATNTTEFQFVIKLQIPQHLHAAGDVVCGAQRLCQYPGI
jgi:hypothetical protein